MYKKIIVVYFCLNKKGIILIMLFIFIISLNFASATNDDDISILNKPDEILDDELSVKNNDLLMDDEYGDDDFDDW